MDTTPAKQLFDLSIRTVGRRHVIDVHGELDLLTSPQLGETVDAALDAGAAELIVDLSGVAFLDSTGMKVLIAGGERCRELRRRLAVVCPQGAPRRALEVAGLLGVIEVHATLRDALLT